MCLTKISLAQHHFQCEDFTWKCEERSNTWWTLVDQCAEDTRSKKCQAASNVWKRDEASVCDKAASCSCGTDQFKIVTKYDENGVDHFNEIVGLYNECKCDFWSRRCEDTLGLGEACDYAAEYCCGDYRYEYDAGFETFNFLNSPQCYCDFYNYAENEFAHKLKPKALNVEKEFTSPCGPFKTYWLSKSGVEKRSLESIYNGTNGQNWTNNVGWKDETVDHCEWYGISCDADGFVTDIDLRDNNLVGQFPIYTRDVNSSGDPILDNTWRLTKYGLASLYKLKTLDLAENELTGTIEYAPLYNLLALTYFNVSENQLSGELEAQVAPSIKYADFSSNNFTSMRRFVQYKASSFQTLRFCDVSNNAIQQDAADLLENTPPRITQFIASNNQFYGSLPASLDNLPKLRQFEMASNALSGILPDFTESFATLQELDLSNQTKGFTGLIPEDVWRSLSLKILNLAGSMLTGTIPSLVGNLAVLEVLDLSNNVLKGSLPSELGLLGGGGEYTAWY